MGDPLPAWPGRPRHQLILFRSPEAFAAAAGPFVREGLACGDDVVAAVGTAQAHALRSVLGADASAVTFASVGDWYRGLVVPIADRPPAPPTRLVGQPPVAGQASASREWLRCEAAANLALPRAGATMACAYDVSSLRPDMARALRATHGSVRDECGLSPSPDFVAPLAFAQSSDGDPLAPPPDSATEVPFDSATYSRTRRIATGFGAARGLSENQVFDLGLAVTELATNAVRHGGGAGVFRIWADGGCVICEVSDAGHGLADPLGGYLQPSAGSATSGWGLWLVRRVSDLAEVRTSGRGTTVRMRMSVPRAEAPGAPELTRTADRTR